MARQRHKPTDESRTKVQAYATVQVPHHHIAVLMGIDTKTLLKYYRTELDFGKASAIANVSNKQYALCMKGDKAMIAFFLKCQGGWRETSIVQNQELDKHGRPVDQKAAKISFCVFPDGGPGQPKPHQATDAEYGIETSAPAAAGTETS